MPGPFPDQSALDTSVRWQGGVVVVTVRGDVDNRTAPTVAGIVESSSGLSVLLDAHRNPDVGAVRVVATARAVTRPMTLLGIDTVTPIVGSLADAL